MEFLHCDSKALIRRVEGETLCGASLEGVDLRGAHLSGQSLSRAPLAGADWLIP